MQITIALAKGRLAEMAEDLLERCGLDVSELREDSRKLVFYDRKNDVRYLLVKPTDVPVYVDHGVADLGVVGKDTLLEAGRPLYEMLDLRYGKCDICVAGYAEKKRQEITSTVTRVATKYPRIAKMYYQQKGENIEIIKLNGSIELGPILGLSDVIVDIVETGTTLKENDLKVITEFMPISARFIANKASYAFKNRELARLLEKLQEVI